MGSLLSCCCGSLSQNFENHDIVAALLPSSALKTGKAKGAADPDLAGGSALWQVLSTVKFKACCTPEDDEDGQERGRREDLLELV